MTVKKIQPFEIFIDISKNDKIVRTFFLLKQQKRDTYFARVLEEMQDWTNLQKIGHFVVAVLGMGLKWAENNFLSIFVGLNFLRFFV